MAHLTPEAGRRRRLSTTYLKSRSMHPRPYILFSSLPLLTVALLLAIAPTTVAQSDTPRVIDRVITSYMSDHRAPGLSVAVVDQSHVIFAHGYGMSDVENNVRASEDTIYRIASISKSITATATMKLVETGKLDLDLPDPEILSRLFQRSHGRLLRGNSSPIRVAFAITEAKKKRSTRNTIRASTKLWVSLLMIRLSSNQEPRCGPRLLWIYRSRLRHRRSFGHQLRALHGAGTFRAPAQMPATRLDDVFAIIPHRARGYRISGSGESSRIRSSST